MASRRVRCCCSFSSRRSLASADWVMAARCMLPSGFFTILMGDTSTPDRLLCPARNAGSASLMSISNSSSLSSSKLRMPWPSSASKVGYSVTSSTPALISWLISHFSGLVMRFPGRRFVPASSAVSRLCLLRPDRPCSADISLGPPAGMDGLERPSPASPAFTLGSRSCPVTWSTSRMLRDSCCLPPTVDTRMTLTQHSCPRFSTSRALLARVLLISLTCTSPSALWRIPCSSTNAPKSMTLLTLPRYTLCCCGESSIMGGGGIFRADEPLRMSSSRRLSLRARPPSLPSRWSRLSLSRSPPRPPSRPSLSLPLCLPRSPSLQRSRSSSCRARRSRSSSSFRDRWRREGLRLRLRRAPLPLTGGGTPSSERPEGSAEDAVRAFPSCKISCSSFLALSRVSSMASPEKAPPRDCTVTPPSAGAGAPLLFICSR
mmetsp:Transcript_12824/g.38740  ORF Transcript_12824/g.38740 Transcript_12824/m.38740 type:complete len:432 (+) Transcript_12824:2696-3991(+)